MSVNLARPRPTTPRHLRARLMLGCALGTSLAVLGSGEVRAQAFLATPTTQSGEVFYDRGTPGVERIIISSDQAIILWRPDPPATDPEIFLPAGNTATFINGNVQDFAVLNRIITTVPVRFDGTVLSRLDNGAGEVPGGTVIFASPGGIIVGPTGVFDVGNLVLTSLNVVDDGAGNFIQPGGGLLFDSGGANPGAAVITEAGSQIIADGDNSHVALVGQNIGHAGSVRVNGSAAYVAAEEVLVRFDEGLFDILITAGSDNPFPITHTGSTGGPASTGAADRHGVYMASAPKNQAITLLLSGSVGFDAADSASVENGEIVLSSGFNIVNGVTDDDEPVEGILPANIVISGGNFTSDVTAHAFDTFQASSTDAPLDFAGDLAATAGQLAFLGSAKAGDVTVGGDLSLRSVQFSVAADRQGGMAMVTAEPFTTVTIVGDATLDVSATGIFGETGNAGAGRGGEARITADDGDVAIGGDLTLIADGAGASGEAIPDQGGDGIGGDIFLLAEGGDIAIGGDLTATARGDGSRANGTVSVTGSEGRGGEVQITAQQGDIGVGGSTEIDVEGEGGLVEDGVNVGGFGHGGLVVIAADRGSVDVGDSLEVDAGGFGGDAALGGEGQGGNVNVTAVEGEVMLGAAGGSEPTGTISANGDGGESFFVAGGNGGAGNGGEIRIRANSGPSGSTISGNLELSAEGAGGDGANLQAGGGGSDTLRGAGGDAMGGTITVVAQTGNASFDIGGLRASVDATAGDGGSSPDTAGGNGGVATAGDILAGVEGNDGLVAGDGIAGLGTILFTANAAGGDGGDGASGGTGGAGIAGSLILQAQNGSVELDDATLRADGRGGAGPTGLHGTGEGGLLTIAASGADGAITGTTLAGVATGLGPATDNLAGQWEVLVGGGEVTFITLDLDGSAVGSVPRDSRIVVENGGLAVTDRAEFTSLGGIDIGATGDGSVTGGDYVVGAGQDFQVSHAARPAGGATIDVRNLTTESDNAVFAAGSATRADELIEVTARDTATIAAPLTAPEIVIASADIDLPAGGALGDDDTESVLLDLLETDAQAVLGGTTNGSGYTLTDAEADRITAARLRVEAPELANGTPNDPDVLIRDLSFAGSRTTIVELQTDGIAQVEGALRFEDIAVDGGMTVEAVQRLQIVNPAGSIRLLDAGGMPGGSLTLVSSNIWSASQALLDQLVADPAFAGRNDALLANPGAVEPRGYIEGGDVNLQVGDTLFVQNSGDATGFAGITVVGNTLTVTPTGNQPLDVYAFGRRINSDDSFVANNDFFFEVVFEQGAQGYRDDAEFNRCIINTGVCPQAGPQGPGIPDGPDIIEVPVSSSFSFALGQAGDELVDTSFAADPLIEEPVTSGADSVLWDCDTDDDGDCDEDDVQ